MLGVFWLDDKNKEFFDINVLGNYMWNFEF